MKTNLLKIVALVFMMSCKVDIRQNKYELVCHVVDSLLKLPNVKIYYEIDSNFKIIQICDSLVMKTVLKPLDKDSLNYYPKYYAKRFDVTYNKKNAILKFSRYHTCFIVELDSTTEYIREYQVLYNDSIICFDLNRNVINDSLFRILKDSIAKKCP